MGQNACFMRMVLEERESKHENERKRKRKNLVEKGNKAL